MNSLSAVIITFNEERNIERCLQSLQGIADEIIVVDSNSTDRTEEICKSHDVRFVAKEWPGYSEQKNFANRLATCDLIFSIDADEAVSEELRQSILQLKEENIKEDQVFSMNRLNNFWGKWIKRCGYYPENKIRIWRRGFVQWEGLIHEWPVYKSTPRKTQLDGDLLHYSYESPEAFKKQLFHFAELNAQSYFERKKKTGTFFWIFSPAVNFIRTYFIKGGILEGSTGFYICRTAMQATRHKYNLLHQKTRQSKQK